MVFNSSILFIGIWMQNEIMCKEIVALLFTST